MTLSMVTAGLVPGHYPSIHGKKKGRKKWTGSPCRGLTTLPLLEKCGKDRVLAQA